MIFVILLIFALIHTKLSWGRVLTDEGGTQW